MTEVVVRKSSEESAMDLSVKCGMITFHRTSSSDDTVDRDEIDDSENAFLQIQLRKRPLEETELESKSSSPGCEPMRRDWYRAVARRSESDNDSRFSSSYSPLQQNASTNGLTARNRRHSPLEDTLTIQQNGSPDEDVVAFMQNQQQQQRATYMSVEYVEMQGLNGEGMTINDDFTTSQQQHPSQPDSSVQYPECVSFGYHPFSETVYGNGVSVSSAPAVSTRAPARHPPSNIQALVATDPRGVSGCYPVAVRPSTVFNPRKRFLTEIRKAAAAAGQTIASPPSSEPSGTFVPLPTAEVPTPSSSEERRCYAAASRGGGSSCFQEKDEAYWERRRKNNEAAKRSRDIRRQKEEQVAARAASLSAENVQLRAQIEVLKTQLALIQSMVINNANRSA